MTNANTAIKPNSVLDLPSSKAFNALIKPEIVGFKSIGDVNTYGTLFEQAIQATKDGNNSAIGVPAGQFIAQATFRVLADPAIRVKLPNEVNERAAAACEVVEEVVNVALENGIFSSAYSQNAVAEYHWKHDSELSSEKYLAGIGKSPFVDSSWVAGGALKLLQRGNKGKQLPNQTAIIKASLGLLVIAKVKDEKLENIRDIFGQPYIEQKHIVHVQDEHGSRVRPTREFIEYLKTFKKFGDGCPAGKMPAEFGHGTVLQQSWREYVDFLVPPHATADQ